MNRFVWLSVLVVLFLMSCSNNGMFVGVNQTNVELSRANYTIVASNLMGQAEAGYLMGFSMSLGSTTQTFALARVSGTGMLYKEALEKLWINFEAQYGKIEGRKLALANVRYDSETLNLLIFSGVKIYVRADVIEFND